MQDVNFNKRIYHWLTILWLSIGLFLMAHKLQLKINYSMAKINEAFTSKTRLLHSILSFSFYKNIVNI